MSWFEGNELLYLMALIVVFASVVSLVFGVRYVASGRADTLRARVRRFTTMPAAPGVARSAGIGETSALLRVTLSPLARLATPTDKEELTRLRAKLVQAGYRSERALTLFLTVKVVLALGLGVLTVWLDARLALPMLVSALLTIAAMAIGFYTPSVYAAIRTRDRQAEISHSLPGALDLLVTCIEAGLGLDEAMNHVAGEIGLSAPLLAAELRQSALEMSAGLGRGEALRRMADRTGVEEIRLLAAMIVQTEMFGTSIARSLRVQAASMRIRRTQLAEERAASVGVRMTFPLIFCIMPALFVVLIGPGIVRFVRVLLPALARGG